MAYTTPTAERSKYSVVEGRFNNIEKINVEDAKPALVFPNFEGRPGKYNKTGAQSFGLVIPQGLADRLASEGWVISAIEDQESGNQIPFLNIRIDWHPNNEKYAATMYSIAFNGSGRKIQTALDENTSKLINPYDLKTMDLRITRHPYTDDTTGEWKANGRLTGAWCVLNQDSLDNKWGDGFEGVPDGDTGFEEPGDGIPFC